MVEHQILERAVEVVVVGYRSLEAEVELVEYEFAKLRVVAGGKSLVLEEEEEEVVVERREILNMLGAMEEPVEWAN